VITTQWRRGSVASGRRLYEFGGKTPRLGEEEEADLGDVGPRRDVTEILFPVRVERVGPSEVEQRPVDRLEVPGISELDPVTVHLGL